MRSFSMPVSGAMRSIWFVDKDSFLRDDHEGAKHRPGEWQLHRDLRRRQRHSRCATHSHSFSVASDASSCLMNTRFPSNSSPP